MSESRLQTKVVRVTLQSDPSGLIFAISPDLKGLLVAKHTVEEVLEEVPHSIAALYAACGERVIVEAVTDSACPSWIAMPVAVAQNALARLSAA